MKHISERGTATSRIILIGLLAGMFFLAGTAQAQQVQSAAQTEQSTNWVNPAVAVIKLKAEIQQLQLQVPGMTPGSIPHTEAVRRIAYFKAIHQLVVQGAGLSAALELALPAAATIGGEQEVSATSKATLHNLREEARSLLSN